MLFDPNFWIILGVLLCVLEIFTGLFVSLSFGLSAFIIYGFLKSMPKLIDSWYELLFSYGLVGLILSIIMWYFFGNKDKSIDIND